VAVRGLSGVSATAAGSGHNMALVTSGKVVTWGENTYGELGDGTTSGPSVCSSGLPCSTTHKPMSGLSKVSAIAAGQYFSLALLSNGRLMAWGLNNYGRLGNGATTSRTRPGAVRGLTGVESVVAAGEHSVAKF
jgi:alpha-tubulin suppressor-like RCC1 family protein